MNSQNITSNQNNTQLYTIHRNIVWKLEASASELLENLEDSGMSSHSYITNGETCLHDFLKTHK